LILWLSSDNAQFVRPAKINRLEVTTDTPGLTQFN